MSGRVLPEEIDVLGCRLSGEEPPSLRESTVQSAERVGMQEDQNWPSQGDFLVLTSGSGSLATALGHQNSRISGLWT